VTGTILGGKNKSDWHRFGEKNKRKTKVTGTFSGSTVSGRK
jgi:hypothetical protein